MAPLRPLAALLCVLLHAAAASLQVSSVEPSDGSVAVETYSTLAVAFRPLSDADALAACGPTDPSALPVLTLSSGDGSVAVALEGGVVLAWSVTWSAALHFDTSYTARFDAGQVCGNATATNADVTWRFETVAAPTPEPDGNSLNDTDVPTAFSVYGIGVFVNDLSPPDLSMGTFYADVRIFIVRYYREFNDPEAALAEATISGTGGSGVEGAGRACNTRDTSNWGYLGNVSLSDDQLTEKVLNLVNIGKLPKLTVVPRVSSVHDEYSDGAQASGAQYVLDHVRARGEFYFSPNLRRYPYQTQSLPISIELQGDVAQLVPSSLLCSLPEFSGFAAKMSSFSADNPPRALDASFLVGESGNWPPFAAGCTAQHEYPYKGGSSGGGQECRPQRVVSRLTMDITYSKPKSLASLLLLPSGLITCGALVSYSIRDQASRLSLLSTSLLALVIQHSSIRSDLPPQSVMTLADAFVFGGYVIIVVAVVGAVAVMAAEANLAAPQARWVRRGVSACGLSSTLFLFMTTEAFGDPKEVGAWVIALLVWAAVSTATIAARVAWLRRKHRDPDRAASCCPRAEAAVRQLLELNPDDDPASRGRRYQSQLLLGPEAWTASDVKRWLATLPPSEAGGVPSEALRFYARRLGDECVDGPALPSLTVERLCAMKVPFGHACRVVGAVERLLDDRPPEPLASRPQPRAQDLLFEFPPPQGARRLVGDDGASVEMVPASEVVL